jgi:magnesium chelatase family protein
VLASLLSATLVGLEGRVIRVEVDVAPGLPGFTIVGLADASVREARERVRGAIRNAGFVHPPRRITVNLAPADLPKSGPSADLAIAIGILIGSEQFTPAPGRAALIGELSLSGEVRRVPGLLPMVAAVARRGVARVVVPAEAVVEAGLVTGIEVIPATTLGAVVDALRSRRRRGPSARASIDLASRPGGTVRTGATSPVEASMPADVPDLAEVRGQAEARRALEVALAGGHGLLLLGPPGTGKTMLARTIPGLLPPLGDDAALEATIVASVSGTGPIAGLVRRPPFRAPHHTTSYAAMVGGGPQLTPGEITRADGGTLFLDELAEFSRDVLEALRQPLEDGRVSIVRAGRAATLPARFQLVAAMNPCPCGYATLERRGQACRCSDATIERYQRRISGPLRDRIDLWVGMPRMPARLFVAGPEPEPSRVVAARIAAARSRQLARPGRLLTAWPTSRPTRRRDWSPSRKASACRAAGRTASCAWHGRSRISRTPTSSSPTTSRRPPAGGCRRPDLSPRWRSDGRTAGDRPMIGVGVAVPAVAVSAAERAALAVLVSVQHLGPITLSRLIASFGTAVATLDAAGRRDGPAALRAASTGPDGAARPIPAALAGAVVAAAASRSAIADRIAALGLRVLVEGDADYPRRLRSIELPPTVLFARGDTAFLNGPSVVAVVGTRHPTDAGRRTAARIGRALARAEAVVVSGLAVGIDGASHAAVLDAGGRTAAYIGGGHERLFPIAHDRLAAAIVDHGGAILSEYAPDALPTKGTFPRRNRLISGSSDAVIVVEAGARSGAILTANWALEQGRPCHLVPGSIDDPMSAGCLGFLRDWPGEARIVSGIPQLLDDLGLPAAAGLEPRTPRRPRRRPGEEPGSAIEPPSPTAALTIAGAAERQIGEAVMAGAATVDEIIAVTHLPVPVVLGSLTRLEAAGLVEARRGRYLPAGPLAA